MDILFRNDLGDGAASRKVGRLGQVHSHDTRQEVLFGVLKVENG